MLKSMTGYGKKLYEDSAYIVEVEVKSLNSKFLDANLKLPKQFADRDIDLRNVLSKILQRGKVSFSIDWQKKGEGKDKVTLDKALLKSYYEELKASADELGVQSPDLFRIALQMPEVVISNQKSEDKEKEWELLMKVVDAALTECDQFRNEEGRNLEKGIRQAIQALFNSLEKIEVQDPLRVINLRQKFKNSLKELIDKEYFDENRYEQEIIYYIEKLDINEEKVRLKTHLNYFLETLSMPESQGKKIGFIAQEIGREINTIGSKANDAVIQRHVVEMKEELEKIKEQMNNIL
jgi:uncharacterized protein (TIGR00255 family)